MPLLECLDGAHGGSTMTAAACPSTGVEDRTTVVRKSQIVGVERIVKNGGGVRSGRKVPEGALPNMDYPQQQHKKRVVSRLLAWHR
jgi:hypothetical protein